MVHEEKRSNRMDWIKRELQGVMEVAATESYLVWRGGNKGMSRK